MCLKKTFSIVIALLMVSSLLPAGVSGQVLDSSADEATGLKHETIGGLFAEVTGETIELSAAQRIWGLIVEVINVIAGFIACDPFELIENVINNNNQIKAVKQAFDRLDLAEAAA